MSVSQAVGAEGWGKREQRTGSWQGWGVTKQDTAAAAQEGRFSKVPWIFVPSTDTERELRTKKTETVTSAMRQACMRWPAPLWAEQGLKQLVFFAAPAFCNRKT